MSITLPTLAAALEAIGNAHVYVGDPFTVSGMAPLGQKEGTIDVSPSFSNSDLTAPELTGDLVHQRTILGVGLTITIPIIIGDDTIYAKISPTGTKSAGWSNPQPVVPTSVLVIPDHEVAGGLAYDGTAWTRTAGNGYTGATGAAAAPKHAVWVWRAAPQPEGWGFGIDNGGKQITSVVFTAMFDGARPEGHKAWTRGDPVAQGITTLRL